ncbi:MULTISPECIES: TonB-dependent receptor [Xanthomonas]|uniref:TonB-dependent receptor n=1 Tax=Xanthomonas phaseoli pv. dieffenbachiae TaxID=92828 RepID=A0A1V9GYN1_9XANT|nr:TonB-dependent receptor [Xanthomonas phaseoli]MBO9766777.1 TonB-dependent receptor [Xanthomonas phaseoli pv. dieffenbachiae]MBO9775877.1 TonB-dependent receptor [Xanthomonas phaseoli pv. dieffenbachiae]MBO9780960.1 TonB-dependent receptor [Xanthomonas phaseoli pv. dieffenbachiae]MBO9788035.1 TonB-dependent receptor [Xanthomonas phaseoli pv. dieffenbachiae]MBO9795088.1 TonB-dependent receptor [Xanthomonas phaseoli pv. dieffenbachiae]
MSVQHRHIPAGRTVGQRSIRDFRRSVMAISVATLLSAQAYAQDATTTAAPASDATTQQLDTVQVTGTRSSVTKAQLVKQNAEQIVDSIVAEDIGKLPDNNVAEALQRISGIQISRNYGEGSSIAIRGLTQVRTELNGRDIFTANDGRGLSFEDVSAELLGGVNVYKNPSADMIEGGLGGTVDLRTRLPFDYDGRKIAGSVQYNYYDLADDGKPAFSGLFSDRWQTGIGEIGILVNYSQQKSPFRQDTISIEPWYTQADLPGYEGQGVSVPHGAGINTTVGERERKTGAFAMQWRPNDAVEVYTQVLRSDYDFSWHDYSFFALTGANPMQGLPGIQVNSRNEFVNGSFQNVPTESNTSLTERHSVTTDYSLGAKWTVNEKLTLSTDFQYVDATTTGTRYILSTGQVTSPQFNVDFRGDLPRLSVTDASGAEGYLADVNNYNGWRYHLDNKDDNKGTEFAWRSDMDLAFDSDFVRSFKAGVRYTDRDAETKGNIYRFMCINNCNGAPFSQYPGIGVMTNPITDFFRGQSHAFGPTLTASDAAVANYQQTLAAFGASPLEFAPNNINTQNEKTYAAYGVLRFGVDGDIPFDGNIGVRVVRTEVGSQGVRTGTDAEGGGLIPVDAQQTYTDVLPSLNLRWMLSDQLQWRFAASRGISRPTFDKLNPNLSLSTGTSNGASTFTGTAGNPSLEAVKADQFDTALEWYFGQGSMMYGTVFYKKVEGFIANAVFNEVYDGQVWQITRPVNGDSGKIRGAELGYTQFFDFLPGWLSGFGLQTNYTYVDSEAPSPTATDTNGQSLTVPLEGLSKNSYNAILSYETSRFQGRVAYNWRSDWLVTTAGNGTGNLPVYNKGFGQLDASLRFNINDVWSISLDGVNLLDTRRESYLGVESRYRDFVINDRRYGLTLRASL